MSSRLQKIASFGLEGSTRTLVEQANSILNFVEDFATDPSVDHAMSDRMRSIADDANAALGVIKKRDAASVFQGWAFNVANASLDALKGATPSPATEAGYARILNSATDLLEHTSYVLGDGDVLARQRKMLGELSDSVVKAQTAAGTVGSYTLADYFGEYATEEKEAANRFRTVTIAGIILAIGVAVAFTFIDWTPSVYSDTVRWMRVISHGTIVLGVGTLTAYLGRQAGQHRRMFNWAKSMEVQLKSFPAFIEPLTDDVQADIYRVFSHRVLAAPPDREKGSDETIPAAQILDVALAALKRTP